MHEILPDTASITSGRFTMGGCDALDLAATYGTPLVVMDRATIESRAGEYAEALGAERIFYAGKAFCCVAICELLANQGLGLDVCTGGELATALAAGFPTERIIFHGNNKSERELEMVAEARVGRLVVDSSDEIERLSKIPGVSKLLLRITPGVEAHTHEFVQTGQEDSKFGFTIAEDVARDAVVRAMGLDGYGLVGLHAHIGSQIFELAAYDLAVRRIAAFAGEMQQLGCEVRELNLGGGLGIAHTHDEVTPSISGSVGRIVSAVEREFQDAGLPVPEVFLEPGRSIVGSSAVTLYEVGTVKHIPGVRTYVSVDGGMSDNIRPALYSARYEAFLANRPEAPPGPRVTVCGKHCESGDVLIRDVHLPSDVGPGDILCIPATGAYAYSMANNYNHVTRPAVVMVDEGRATEIVRRETHEDLLRLDRRLDGTPL